MTEQTYSLRVNGEETALKISGATPLLYVLRNDLGLKGTRFGCGEGACGACTVILDGSPVQSCDVTVEYAAGKSIETIEGLGRDGELHPLQQALLDEQAGQCGYCLSGIVMSAKALLDRIPSPSRAEIADALDGNLCRCGSHPRLLRAIARLAASGAGADAT